MAIMVLVVENPRLQGAAGEVGAVAGAAAVAAKEDVAARAEGESDAQSWERGLWKSAKPARTLRMRASLSALPTT